MTVIDDYLAKVSEPQKSGLEHIRQIVKELVPDAEETIGYGMPVMRYKRKYLIGFCQFKDHLSIFPGAGPIETFKAQLKDFKTSKGTVQFTEDKPIPDKLLKEIIIDCRDRI